MTEWMDEQPYPGPSVQENRWIEPRSITRDQDSIRFVYDTVAPKVTPGSIMYGPDNLPYGIVISTDHYFDGVENNTTITIATEGLFKLPI